METEDERRELSHVADGPVLLGQEVGSSVSLQAVGLTLLFNMDAQRNMWMSVFACVWA